MSRSCKLLVAAIAMFLAAPFGFEWVIVNKPAYASGAAMASHVWWWISAVLIVSVLAAVGNWFFGGQKDTDSTHDDAVPSV